MANFGKQNCDDPLPCVCIQKNVQNVPVCTGTTRACFNTCARGAGIHGDVLNVHTVTFLNHHGFFHVSFSMPQHTQTHTRHTTTTHTTQTTPRPQRHTPHHNTQHHTETERRERERQRERQEDKRQRDKTVQDKKTREDEGGETRQEDKRR